jgi:hypothetical protein
MKTLLIGLLALTSTSILAADHLQVTAKSLEQDYQMICTETSESSINCHDKESKLVGVSISMNGSTLTINDINKSKNALLSSNRANDSRFWGKKIVTSIIANIAVEADADCAELHENFVGKSKDYVFKPWWNEVMRTECLNAKGEKINVKANIGQDGNFLRNIKIF